MASLLALGAVSVAACGPNDRGSSSSAATVKGSPAARASAATSAGASASGVDDLDDILNGINDSLTDADQTGDPE